MMETSPIARRAMFTKEGSPNLSILISQNKQGDFWFAVNGNSGVIWPRYTPQELMSGNTPAMTLDRAWEAILAKYPGYSATVIEEGFPSELAV